MTGHVMVSFVVVIVAENMKYVMVLAFNSFFLFIFFFFLINSYKHKICWGGRHARLFYFQFFQFIHKKKKEKKKRIPPAIP